MKKETFERFKANPLQRKKFFQDEQSKIQVQLASIIKDREDAQQQRDANKKKITELKGKDKEKHVEVDTIQQKIQAAEREINSAKEEKKKIAY